MHDPQATAAAEAPLPPLEGEALRDAVIKQVEYYLSRQNLANDYYLVSRMNSELFVPIEVIATMPKMKAFSVDVAYITNALKGSTQVVVDEKNQAVKPTFKLTRSTIILRDVPSDVTKEEVIALFAPDVCGPVSNVHADVGDTWFVQLEDEEHMRKAYAHITSQQLRGQPVRARVKSENLLRSIPGGLPAGDGFGRGGNYVPRGGPMGPYGGFGRGGYAPTYDPNAPPPGPVPGGEYRGGGRGGQGGGYRGRGNGRADGGGAPNAGAGGVPLAAGGGVPLVGTPGGAAPVMRRESGGRTGGDEFRRAGGGGGRGGGQGSQGGQDNRRAPGGGGGQRNKSSPRQGGPSGAPHSGGAVGANAGALPGAAAGGAGSGGVGGGVAGMNPLVQSLSSEKKGTPPPQLGPMNFPPLPSKGANAVLPTGEAQVNGTADSAVPAGDSPAAAPAAASAPSATSSSTLSPSSSSAAPHHDVPRFSDIVAANAGTHSPSPSAAAAAAPSSVSVSVSAPAPIAAPAPVAPAPAVVQSSPTLEAAHSSHEAPAERASPGLRSWSAVVAKDAPKKP